MKRRHRLSRSRDFDTVYRHGRSAATRHLVLYAFARDDAEPEPRLGLAVSRQVGGAVERNRVKRRLRAAFDEIGFPVGQDYVLVARAGLAETAEARGFPWLVDEVREALGKLDVPAEARA